MAGAALLSEINWDELDDLKFVDEEAHVADLMERAPLDEPGRTAAVRRARARSCR